MLFCFGSYVDVLLSKAAEKKVYQTAKCAEQNIRTGTQIRCRRHKRRKIWLATEMM